MYKLQLDDEQYKRVYAAWKSDYDEEGFDYPFLEFWARRRWDASVYGRVWYFKDATAAVEFKLTLM